MRHKRYIFLFILTVSVSLLVIGCVYNVISGKPWYANIMVQFFLNLPLCIGLHEQRPALGLHGGQAAALSLGSSIMPGKINPTLSEMVIQIAHQVVGNDVAVSMATTRANLTSMFGMPPSTSVSSRACSSSATNLSS